MRTCAAATVHAAAEDVELVKFRFSAGSALNLNLINSTSRGRHGGSVLLSELGPPPPFVLLSILKTFSNINYFFLFFIVFFV